MKNRAYDQKQYFDDNIRPLLDQIKRHCGNAKIPYYFSLAVSNDDEKTDYESAAMTPGSMGFEVAQDTIIDHVKVGAGFETVLPDDIPDIVI